MPTRFAILRRYKSLVFSKNLNSWAKVAENTSEEAILNMYGWYQEMFKNESEFMLVRVKPSNSSDYLDDDIVF